MNDRDTMVQMNRIGLRLNKWLGVFIFCALIGAFIVLSSEVQEAAGGQPELIGRLDQALLNLAVAIRSPSIDGVAIDLTAMGSGVVLSILVGIFGLFFVLQRKYRTALQLVFASAGAGVVTHLLKSYFERSRPAVAFRVVEVHGFSYPSGHSLASAAVYFSIAIVLSKSFRSPAAKAVIHSIFLALILLIGFTRIYLGVHFFSDVTAGILLGIAWASLMGFLGDRWEERGRQ
jgi:undecaprenyl-diphosphatase